jgi:hypothetical protein
VNITDIRQMAVGRIANLRQSYVSSKPKSSRRTVDDVERSRHPAERQEAQNFPSSRRTSPVSLSQSTRHSNALRCRYDRRPQFCDQPQDVGEQVSWDCDLGHLERKITPVADDLRADLDQFFLQARQRPLLDGLRRRQSAKEIAEIVGERMKLKADCIGGERAA